MPASATTRRVAAYRVLVVFVPIAVAAFCAVAALLGEDHHGDRSYYFRDITDTGHPGSVVVLTSIGFGAAAVLCGLLALQAPDDRAMTGWSLMALLLAVMSLDNLSRIHSAVPNGALVSRALYLVAAVAALLCVANAQRRVTARVVGVIAGLFAAMSELFDLWTQRLAAYSATYQTATVLEESAGTLAAWFAVLALISELADVGWFGNRRAS